MENVRKYVLCAILRNIRFTSISYTSFIELQEKLHQNICRRRTLVSIGTHDYDTIKGPVRYDIRFPSDIRFIPLNQTSTFTAIELMEYYKVNSKHSRQVWGIEVDVVYFRMI
jgi:phenylalanyl-tRNA synthetase beta chain